MTRGPKSPIKIDLTEEDKIKLEKLLEVRGPESKVGKRIRTILMISEGKNISQIKRLLNLERRIIRIWANRYLKDGFDVLLKDRPRPGRPRKFSDEDCKVLLKMASEEPGKYGLKQKKWSCEALKKELMKQGLIQNISPETIRRILKKV